MAALPSPLVTVAKYLELDRCAERGSEYYDGAMYPIETSGQNHGRIQINLFKVLDSALENSPCELVGATVRVRIPNSARYTYPDVIVSCGGVMFEDTKDDTLLNPKVLFEVLSPSTEGFDRGKKFEYYRSIPSFEEYVLVSQNRLFVERFRRQGQFSWQFEEIRGMDGVLKLESLGIEIPVREIYAKIVIPTET